MKIFATISALAALSTLSLGVLAAEAGPRRGGHGGDQLVRELVQTGALTKQELQGLRPSMKAVRECHRAMKQSAQPKGACLPKRIEAARARLALLQGAAAKVTDPALKARVEQRIARVTKRIAKMESRATAPTPPPPAK